MISPFPYKWAKFGIGYVRRLQPAAWFRFGMGITVTGAGVSQWDDQSGNGRHLKQGTDANRPALQSDGSILFDGVDNYLKCDAFTLAQPETVYVLFKQITWTGSDTVFDGNAINTMRLFQAGSTPNLALHAGTATAPSDSPDLELGQYAVMVAIYNGSSSLLQTNSNAPVSGTPGSAAAGGFTLGANGTPDQYGHIQVKEVLIYPGAHDADQRIRIARYLTRVGEMGLLQ